jgi:hypothetical protein
MFAPEFDPNNRYQSAKNGRSVCLHGYFNRQACQLCLFKSLDEAGQRPLPVNQRGDGSHCVGHRQILSAALGSRVTLVVDRSV